MRVSSESHSPGWPDRVPRQSGTPTADPYHRGVHATPRPIVGLGAGTHAKSLLEALRSTGEFEVVALVDDDPARVGTKLLGYPVRGPEALAELQDGGVADAFAGIGGVVSSEARKAAFSRLLEDGFRLPAIVHATASVSRFARLGNGCQVLARTVINADAELGENAIVNTAAVVEHDCRIGSHVHVGPGALLGGLVTVQDDAQIGIGRRRHPGDARSGQVPSLRPARWWWMTSPAGARVAGVPARPIRASSARARPSRPERRCRPTSAGRAS